MQRKKVSSEKTNKQKLSWRKREWYRKKKQMKNDSAERELVNRSSQTGKANRDAVEDSKEGWLDWLRKKGVGYGRDKRPPLVSKKGFYICL